MSIQQCIIFEIPGALPMNAYMILMSISGNSSVKLHYWNVVNMPYNQTCYHVWIYPNVITCLETGHVSNIH